MRVCPVTLAIFLASAAAYTLYLTKKQSQQQQGVDSSSSSDDALLPECQVVFVLGGPGAGKGTQCQLVEKNLCGWTHLSAGDLLRQERKRGGALADQINSLITEGKLVPAEITVNCLRQGMLNAYREQGTTRFLIDGFPRNQDNVTVWQQHMPQHRVESVLYFDCPEEVLVGRLLERSKTSGRNDDNLDTIRKRFQTFQEQSLPIVELYQRDNKVYKIPSDQSVQDVYKQVEAFFNTL